MQNGKSAGEGNPAGICSAKKGNGRASSTVHGINFIRISILYKNTVLYTSELGNCKLCIRY